MSEGVTSKVEDGQESKDKGSFSLPEMYGGAGGYATGASQDKGGAKGKAPPPKAAPPKQPAKGGKESALEAEEAQNAKEEAQRKSKMEAERAELRA